MNIRGIVSAIKPVEKSPVEEAVEILKNACGDDVEYLLDRCEAMANTPDNQWKEREMRFKDAALIILGENEK